MRPIEKHAKPIEREKKGEHTLRIYKFNANGCNEVYVSIIRPH